MRWLGRLVWAVIRWTVYAVAFAVLLAAVIALSIAGFILVTSAIRAQNRREI
jgi:hypothetical protein